MIDRKLLEKFFGQNTIALVIKQAKWNDWEFEQNFEKYIICKLDKEEKILEAHNTVFSKYENDFMSSDIIPKLSKQTFESFKTNCDNRERFFRQRLLLPLNGEFSSFLQVHYFALLMKDYLGY